MMPGECTWAASEEGGRFLSHLHLFRTAALPQLVCLGALSWERVLHDCQRRRAATPCAAGSGTWLLPGRRHIDIRAGLDVRRTDSKVNDRLAVWRFKIAAFENDTVCYPTMSLSLLLGCAGAEAAHMPAFGQG